MGESFSRPFSPRELREEVRLEKEDYFAPDEFNSVLDPETAQTQQALADKVLAIDPYYKSLTGRTVERLAAETGIPAEELFPPDARILYVGDPWQRMGVEIDDPNLTLIDYEFGETASFIDNEEQFRETLESKGTNLTITLQELLEDEEAFLTTPESSRLESLRQNWWHS